MEVTSRSPRFIVLIGLVAALLLASLPALAQQPSKEQIAKARGHYNQGIELYEEGDFDAALVEFQRAYDIAPAYKILYNIGLVQRQLNDHAGALRAFTRFLDEGGKKVDQKRRSEVEREIQKLQGRVAKLTIKSNVDQATVLVDDAERAETPLDEPLLVNAGRRKITLTKSGYSPLSRVVKLAGGDEQELTFELRESDGSEPATPPPSTPPASDDTSQPPPGDGEPVSADEGKGFPWLPWAITGALAVGTGVAAVMTMSAESDLKSERDGVTTRERLDDAEGKTRTLALVTDVLLAATVISAGVSLWITLDSDDSDPAKESAARARPLQIGVGPGSVNLRGSF